MRKTLKPLAKTIHSLFWGAVIVGAPILSLASTPDYTAMVDHLSHGKMHLLKTVPTQVKGLTGLITETRSGKKVVTFGLDGKYLIVGAIIDNNGHFLNAEFAQKSGIIPKPIPQKSLMIQAVKSDGFILGHSGPMIIAFMDPNCIACHNFYESMLPELNDGKIQIKVIPVAFLKPSSLPKDVSIMTSKSPSEAWSHNEKGFNEQTEEGATLPAKNMKEPETMNIEKNTQLLAKSGEIATPTIIVCEKSGKLSVWHGASPENLQKLKSGDFDDLLMTGKCQS